MTETINLKEQLTVVDFSNLILAAKVMQESCADYSLHKVTSSELRFNSDSGKIHYAPESGVRMSPISRYALSQLCAKIGVPMRYVEKMMSEGMLELVADNINSWVDLFKKDLFIREYKNEIRGVLSNRYSVLDTPDILDVVGETLPTEYSVKGSFMNQERLHVRLAQKEMMNIDGEDLFAGIQIDSSDVGRSILTCTFFIYKQVCTNGLCISKGGGVLFEQKHIGISKDDFLSNFKESVSRIPVLTENMRELIVEAKKDEVNVYTEEEMKAFTDNLQKNALLSEEATKNVTELMSEKYGYTRWGVINSITELAQQYTLERRLELEKFAGLMLVA